MDTNQLLKKTQKTLERIKTEYEQNKKKLEQLLSERGVLLASRIVDTEFSDEEKITKLNKAIDKLRVEIDQAGTPLISALKAKILSLRSRAEKEDKDQAKNSQTKLEILLNETSQKVVTLLKEIVKLNSRLKEDWASWDKLDLISGKGLVDKKTIRPSVDMLEKVCGTLLSEWAGSSDGKTRKFYSKDRYDDTRLIF